MSLALACSIGLHWCILQSVAWTGMLVNNLGTFSFSSAVERTFDGKHPCCLCKAIESGKKAEKKSTVLVPVKKLDAMSPVFAMAPSPPASFPRIATIGVVLEDLPHTPPSPPPRAV
jgi:hypothetical protein